MDSKINNLINSADIYFYLNNAYIVSFLKLCEKVIKDKNYNILFDKNVEDKKVPSINALIKNKDKEVEIKINPYSQVWGEIILIHEITHAIENKKLKKLAYKYIKKYYGLDIKWEYMSEALADISSFIFGNKEFINNLSLKKPKIYKRINNIIISFKNKIINYRNKELFIEDLKNKWEKAYRKPTNEKALSIINSTKYHVSRNLSNDIDNVLNNIKERNPVKLRDYTPDILVKSGIKNLPMYENPSHIRKNILTAKKAKNLGLSVMSKDHYHGLGKDVFVKVIDSLDNPRIIFKNKHSNNYLIISTIKDAKGNNIIVPIEIETSTNVNNIKLDVNRIMSIYGKENLNTYIKNNINQNVLEKIYEQKKERGTGLIPAASSFTDNSILQAKDNVKLSN